LNPFLHKLLHTLSYNANEPWQFMSVYFMLFLIVVFSLNALLANKPKWRIILLCTASVYFYYMASGVYVVLLLLSIIANYGLGLLIGLTQQYYTRFALLWLSVAINVYLLAIFKYSSFIKALIYGASVTTQNLVLPIAISFFTFENISYVVDVYKRNTRAETRFINYFLFISFFPKLIAGPIIRAKHFIPQLAANYNISALRYKYGLTLIMQGYFYKCILADTIAVHLVNPIYINPSYFTSAQIVVACLGYTLQIYLDFSGYTHIARGIAAWLGIRVPINFNAPYTSQSITEFWQRWHISLSTWLRNYVYIPLGGNKKGAVLTYINLLLTMLIGGLWHGAALQFMLWGLLHGALLALERLGSKAKYTLPLWFKTINTFITVSLLWILFRAPNFATAQQVYNGLYNKWQNIPNNIHSIMVNKGSISVLIIALLIITVENKITVKKRLQIPSWLYIIALVCVLVYVAVLQKEQATFIYFQF
jgi:alginate O-acetyltransferase complex protein AlgI